MAISGSAYTAGGFPVAVLPGGYAQPPSASGGDIFVVKFNPMGARLWATIYGFAIGREDSHGIATDANNNIYLLMEIEDKPGSDVNDACSYQPLYLGYESPLIVKFNTNGRKLCATYIGGNGHNDEDNSYDALTVYGNSLYIAGSSGGGFPATPGAFQTAFSGSFNDFDATVLSLCINICEAKKLALAYTANTTTACANAPVKFTPSVNNACDTTGYRFHWVFAGGTPAVSDSVSPTVKFSGAGNYDVKLVVTTLCKKDSITKTNYITVNSCGGCTLNAQYTKGTANCPTCGCKEWIMVTATGGTSPYNYQWPDGYDKRYKNALCPGIYNVIVTDNNGCKTTVKVNAP
ncbi:MAG: PKD domain-containing protein [Bacteroidia bacterium]|nr:PKD domain-containing protein [Bacteroidia bacterium]